MEDKYTKVREFRVVITKKGEDDSNILYWAKRSKRERMRELEKMRQEVNQRLYGHQPKFQSILTITKRKIK